MKAEEDVADISNANELDEDGLTRTETFNVPKWVEPASDDELVLHYDVANAWNTLFSFVSCQEVIITERIQKYLNLLVGVHVTQEFPWKQIKFKYLSEHLFDNIDNGGFLQMAFHGFNPEEHVLIGYAPLLTQNQDSDNLPDGDPFIFFSSTDEMKIAIKIIRNIENYERWLINKRVIKTPKVWRSFGSENEIAVTKEEFYIDPVTVEIQSIYPLEIPEQKTFVFRTSECVRDGYMELVPSESMKFENVNRKRVTVAIQSSPACVDLAIQTNPTFPTNAFSQYFYEIKPEEDGLEDSSEDEEQEGGPKSHSRPGTPAAEPVVKPPPEPSEAIKLLLKTLDFNQVDMYRNDYLLIWNKPVEHYSNPYLEEVFCFANISKSFQRYVCGIDWFPSLSGLMVTSYTFTTPATIELVSRKVDTVQRAVLQPNPILMWSFSDNLNYKLEFESPLEVTTLSFCPHDSDILLGGAINGQITIWDLQNRTERLDQEEILSSAQAKYRLLIGDFLKWTIQTNEDLIVPPALITSLEMSQKGAITGIYWLGRNSYINTFGKLYNSVEGNFDYKYFITTSMDGTITFWNLDGITEKKGYSGSTGRDQPKALTQSESPFKNKTLKPVFTVAFNEPITAIIGDTSVFKCIVTERLKFRKNRLNYRTVLEARSPKEVRQSVIVSTFYGRIERLSWMGVYSDTDGKEHVTTGINFARVHDGPVVAMKKNPFYPNIFATIGRTVFAIWKADYNYSPIFWRKRITDLTTVAWSEDRPGVLFITRIDGFLEAWDILARDDDACLNDILGGGIMTAISEHRPWDPDKLLGIGDYNSSFRMVKLPPTFYIPLSNESQLFMRYIVNEESRKKSIQEWEQKFYENNKDVIEAKRQAQQEARKEMERLDTENMVAPRKVKERSEHEHAVESGTHQTYTDRMRRQWDELNLNRLLGILMSRKRVNSEQLERETILEKQRLAYEAAKKASLYQILQHASEEVAAVRARILPAEVADLERKELVVSAVADVMKLADTYANIETESEDILNEFDEFPEVNYLDFLDRGCQRRQILMKSLGGNTERLCWYEIMRASEMLEECDWGYDRYLTANAELIAREESLMREEQGSTSYIFVESIESEHLETTENVE